MFSTDGYKRNSKDVNNKQNLIASGDITMQDVDFPVHGVDNLGNEKIMEPGKDYSFPGDIVLETPLNKNNMGYDKENLPDKEKVGKHENTGFKMSGFPMIEGTKSHLKQTDEEAKKTVDDAQKSFDAIYQRYTGMLEHGDMSDFGHQKVQSTRSDLIKQEKALKTAKADYEKQIKGGQDRNPEATFYD
tara:strand:+ start:490 stop:1053 length:564 start_codon:yes stop_codon:yes gene_type:complete